MRKELEQDTAWGHFLAQHRTARNAENFVRPFYVPLDRLAAAGDAMLRALDMEGVTGERLDLIGSIVGASRVLPQGITLAYFGFITQPSGRGFGIARMRNENEPTTQAYTANDVEFRTLIKAKIALNNGHGTAGEIEESAKLAFNSAVASARDAGNATIDLWIGRIPGADEGIGRIIPEYLPRSAGVKINIKFWEPSLPFGFSNNEHFGFGIGILARTPQSQ